LSGLVSSRRTLDLKPDLLGVLEKLHEML